MGPGGGDRAGSNDTGKSGPTVVLRGVRPADLPVLFVFHADQEANRMAAFGTLAPNDRAAFDAKWTSMLGDRSVVVRAIVVDGVVVGSIMLWRDPELDGPEVSYWLGRAFWGRGLATGALLRFLDVVSERPLYGRAVSTNVGSLRVLEKCGFRRVRVDRGVPATSGNLVDEVILRLDAIA